MKLRSAQTRQEQMTAGYSAGRLGLRLLSPFGLRVSGGAARLMTPQLCLLCTSLPAHKKGRSTRSIMSDGLPNKVDSRANLRPCPAPRGPVYRSLVMAYVHMIKSHLV